VKSKPATPADRSIGIRAANDENSPQPPAEEANFEDGLKRLEQIVRLLEDGDLGLNEALERYEEGVKLLRQSYLVLQRAERRIELLGGIDSEGKPVVEPFDDESTFSRER
jgi:exodeoxyribonuclease VII small subunit